MDELRYYQSQAIEAAFKQWETVQSTAIISATGTGKTEMYMAISRMMPGRVLVLVHRDYLINQPVARLERQGFDDVAIEKADKRSEGGYHKAKIVFASVQSIGPESQEKRLKTFDPFGFSLVIVDEGHRAVGATYRRVLDYFTTNPACKVLILTATPKRKDGVALENVCQSVAYTYGPKRAMEEGWIVPVKFFSRDVKSLDFSNVRLKGRDLDPEQVEQLLLQEKPLHEICSSLCKDIGPTIVFCQSVAVCNAYATLMNTRYRPHSSVALSADSTDEEREQAVEKLSKGEIDYIFNVDLFTEGMDVPGLLRVVWACPTASLVRYTQGVGRVFRTHASLRNTLNGGIDEAPARRRFISDSPKPFGIVVTYYPQNCKHELCDPTDILGGDEVEPAVKKFAKQVQEETSKQSGGSETEYDIETAKTFVDFLGILDAKRKQLKAEASYVDREFDAMGGARNSHKGNAPSQISTSGQWPQGEAMTEPQSKWFKWKRINTPEGTTKFQASVVRDLITLGVSPQTAFSYGKQQALKVRDEIQQRKGTNRAND